MQIDGLQAVVTGGASGLGEATARMLAEAGAQVAIFDMNAERGEAVAAEIGGSFHAVDVSDAASVTAGLAGLSPRICVNCAGIAPGAKTVDRDGNAHDAALFAKAIGINLIGSFNVASQCAALMAGQSPLDADGARGVIINTASVAAFEGQIGQTAYAASKGGVAALTLPMARDMARSGVRVMAIAPGLFLTPMLEGLPPEIQESLGAQAPFPPRLGKPSEFADLVRHIVENQMLNGEVIRLDAAIRMTPK
ncbi:MAG TPA: SDR family NAD(P)-dependent oxidoreductase [Rhodobacteraceae bacterium]|nr:SDR family NAD(P)-dependent oxidoreductase [Paracoccaceae bacterium]